MSRASHVTLSIWARAEPFTYGIFQVHPHPRLAVHNIKKLVTYAKTKNKAASRLSYCVWKHVACNKLQLTEDLAWVLFYTCLTMSATQYENLKDIDERVFNAANLTEAERIRASQSVDLFTFVLFLYIQQINKISLRASAASASAEWPGNYSRSSELDSGRSTPSRLCRNMDEQNHLQFISENLNEILDLLIEPESHGGNSMDATLSQGAIVALDLILEGSADEGRTINSFSELVHLPSILPATGYSKATHAFHLRGLLSWIRSWLTQNPFSVENCIRNGRRLQWRLPHQVVLDYESGLNDTQQQSQNDVIKRQKIATNSHQVPRIGGHNGNKLVVMSMISRQIIARSSATLDGATLKIHRAHYSYLYLLSPMRSVTLDKCRKLTIVLGPIENTLQLNNCEDCLVIAACRRAVLASCRRCTLHLSIQSRPILIQPSLPNTSGSVIISNTLGNNTSTNTPTLGTPTSSSVTLVGNEEILLAPFHTTYMKLLDHLNKVNLSPKVNYWDHPFLLGQDSSRQDLPQQLSRGRCWELLQPAHFYPFNIPLLLSIRSESMDRNPVSAVDTISNSNPQTTNCLDLSATLITNTTRYLGDSNEINLENYISLANSILSIPLPTAYLMALHERAAAYHKWPQDIANAKLTNEQRHTFSTVIDHRFRQWLVESGNLRQLQLLELSTGHVSTTHSPNSKCCSTNTYGAPLPVSSSTSQTHGNRFERVIRSSYTNGRVDNSVRNDRLLSYSNNEDRFAVNVDDDADGI
ncbi:hypothetical protein MN116_003912 [Schistosoma mekongi]|uniref:TBCC domain-containing protein 1 n=1 Tax=Schistosoma mekongi TaxID=38744 RepID=A0AAE1ZF49_SCHME|nr:hypothetical protein MN116_003912 [Schistosoma mekongi]